ncbi:MAG: 50S ribosomal protein L29 [Microgenomates group bacterium]
MKRNDIKALHTLDSAELQKKLSELQQQLATARLGHRVGKASVTTIARVRDDIARIKTVLREQQLAKK